MQHNRWVPAALLLCDPSRIVVPCSAFLASPLQPRFAGSFSPLLFAALFPLDTLRGRRMPPRRLPDTLELLQPTAATAAMFRFTLHSSPAPTSCILLPSERPRCDPDAL
ncbi:hypothetical protein NDU88_002526 [Pleurodeles waltl]|uniref:Secreted protein n=1 Tax=Pleurodeles waltl TaxID=8319 RepID=A0AAV7RA82_PLEWA|nr:hypothetical protein NDU88_002526 [Pleurodeles waltl]